jgi:arylsulfatase A-like enzyme
MDSTVGQTFDAMDKVGVRDSTIVVLTSNDGAGFLKPCAGWQFRQA